MEYTVIPMTCNTILEQLLSSHLRTATDTIDTKMTMITNINVEIVDIRTNIVNFLRKLYDCFALANIQHNTDKIKDPMQ